MITPAFQHRPVAAVEETLRAFICREERLQLLPQLHIVVAVLVEIQRTLCDRALNRLVK